MHEALVLIHGVNGLVRNEQRDRLVQGLKTVPHNVDVVETGMDDESLDARRLVLSYPDGSEKTLDVVDAYWGDMITLLSRESFARRVWNGARQFGYWVPLVFTKPFRSGGFIGLTAALSSLVLISWYATVIALVVDAVVAVEFVHTFVGALWLSRLSPGSETMAAAVVLSGTGMVLLPVSQVLDLAGFSRRYLKNLLGNDSDLGVRDSVGARIRDVVHRVTRSRRYDRVTVVAHSFGVTIATEVLSQAPLGGRPASFRLVTLGGALDVTSDRAPWVAECIRKCVDRPEIESWHDFYSDTDWLCTATPEPADRPGSITGEDIIHTASFGDRLAGRTHSRYFTHPRVIETLVRSSTAEVAR